MLKFILQAPGFASNFESPSGLIQEQRYKNIKFTLYLCFWIGTDDDSKLEAEPGTCKMNFMAAACDQLRINIYLWHRDALQYMIKS
jgi:hypothetical protein